MKPEGVKTLDWYQYNALFMMEHILGYKRFQHYFGKSQKTLFNKIDSYLPGSDEIIEVENLDRGISKEDFMRLCYEPVEPKVFRGAAKDWEAVKNWNFDFFENNYGDEEIVLNDNVGLAQGEFEELTLKHYVRQMKAGSLKYLRFSDVVNNHEELKNSFDLAWLRKFKLPFSWGEDLLMFMGGKNTVTPLHVGFSSFLFVQVMGEKKWILYPPSNRLFVDARTERTFHYYSNANPYKKDDPAFPLMKNVRHYEVTLKPGDVLWVPSFVWHYVENFTDSIGIRFGRTSIQGAWKSSSMFTSLIFLATNPTVFEHLYSSMVKKKHNVQFTKPAKK